MNKILILATIAIVICCIEARSHSFDNSKFVHPKDKRSLGDDNSYLHNKFVHKAPSKRSVDQDDLEYLNYMQSLNWNQLQNSDLNLNVAGKNYQLTPEFIQKMKEYHTDV